MQIIESMTEIFTINYAKNVSLCNEFWKINPDRTTTDLDLLRKKIEATDLAVAYNGIIPVEIN